MKLRLKIVKGSGEGKSFVFNKAPVRIGRGDGNDLVLNDDGISRLQCELVIESTGVMLRDLQSGNGTKVNDVIATEAELKTGDRIGMGPVTFEVLELDAGDEIQAQDMVARADVHAQAPKPLPEHADHGTKPALPPKSRLAGDAARKLTGIFRTGVVESAEATAAQRRMLRVGAAVVLLVAMGVVYYIVSHRRRDQSAMLFPIDATSATTSYGKGNVDILASDRVGFTFDSQRGRVTLGYAAASVERADQVEIVVNGERVGYAPQAAGGWTTGLTVIVPRRLLKAGPNIVIFDNLDIPARAGHEDDRWGVGQITVTEMAPPEPDQKVND